ncbi:MAG: MBL fold metallo-hydrolase [Syntrophales bacterium]
MQVTEHVHALKVPFPGTNRFVYLYLIMGEKICLIDTGILAGRELLLRYLNDAGRDPREIALIAQTHSHPDHIGLSGELKGLAHCGVAIHPAEKAWVEDIELQARTRPTLTFKAFVQQPVAVDRTIEDGETVEWEAGLALRVIHIPGHSQGHVAFFLPRDGALFTGDGVPAGGVPIYEDLRQSVRSIVKLKQVQGVRALFSSWHEPLTGERCAALWDESLAYLRRVHGLVREIRAASPSIDAGELAGRVLAGLGLPPAPVSPNVITTMEAHLREIDCPDVRELAG